MKMVYHHGFFLLSSPPGGRVVTRQFWIEATSTLDSNPVTDPASVLV